MIRLHAVLYDDRIERWAIPETPAPNDILVYMASGKAVYRLNGAEVKLSKGDVLYIPAGTRRSYRNDAEGPHQKYAAHFSLLPDSANAAPDRQLPTESIGTAPDRQLPTEPVVAAARSPDYVRQRFARLLFEWFDREHGSSLVAEGILLELLGLMVKESAAPAVSARRRQLVRRIQEYMIHNASKPLRLSDLAAFAGCSPNHVTKLFKETLKQTPTEYMHQIKVAIACELLRSKSMTVAQVSDHLGNCEQSYFHRIFKRYTGLSPSTVRKGEPW